MVGPDADAVVHEVLHPAGGPGGGRLYDAGRKSERHRRLELEEPVEDPEGPKPIRRTRRAAGSGPEKARLEGNVV